MKLGKVLSSPLLHPLIRRKAKVHETPLSTFSVRVARTVEEHEDAFALVHTAYAYLGIESVRRQRLRTTPQHVLPESTVLVAYEGEQLVGTMTVTLDSPAGLPLENDYLSEIEALRAGGDRLVEFGSLAVVKRCWHLGVTTLLNIAAVHWSFKVLGATRCVIGVHPKAASFYRAVYCFQTLGQATTHVTLAAPVIGLQMSFDEMLSHTRRKLRKPFASGLTLAQHMGDQLPDCIELPTSLTEDQLIRWKLPREVFQELFMKKTRLIKNLDARTKKHLERHRSDATLFNRPIEIAA